MTAVASIGIKRPAQQTARVSIRVSGKLTIGEHS